MGVLTERHSMRRIPHKRHPRISIIPRHRLPYLQLIAANPGLFRDPLNRTRIRFRPLLRPYVILQSLESTPIFILVIPILDSFHRPRRQDLKRPRTRILLLIHIKYIQPDIVAQRVYRDVDEGVKALFNPACLVGRVRDVEVHEGEGEDLVGGGVMNAVRIGMCE